VSIYIYTLDYCAAGFMASAQNLSQCNWQRYTTLWDGPGALDESMCCNFDWQYKPCRSSVPLPNLLMTEICSFTWPKISDGLSACRSQILALSSDNLPSVIIIKFPDSARWDWQRQAPYELPIPTLGRAHIAVQCHGVCHHTWRKLGWVNKWLQSMRNNGWVRSK